MKLFHVYYTIIFCLAGTVCPGQTEIWQLSNRVDSTYIRELVLRANKHPNNDSAYYLYKQAYLLSINNNYEPGIIKSLLNHAFRLNKQGNYQGSLKQYFTAAAFCRKNSKKWASLLPSVFYNIACEFQMLGQYDSAIHYCYLALDKEKESPSLKIRTKIYNSLGSALNLINESDKALYYLMQAKKIDEQSRNPHDLGITLSNIAVAYSCWDAYDSAMWYYKQAIILNKKQKDLTSLHNNYTNLGKLYLAQQLPEKALTELLKANQLSESINAYYINASTAFTGIAYAQLKDYRQALHYFNRALAQAEQLNLGRNKYEIQKELSKVYAATGNYREAYEQQLKYIGAQDTLMSTEKIHSPQKLDVQYRSIQKDKELVAKQLQIARQENRIREKNFWLYSIGIGSLLLCIIIISIYRSNLQKQKAKTRQLHILQQQQEIKQLKAMMEGEEKERGRLARELHDGIGGMLASIRMNLGAAKNEYKTKVDTGLLDELTYLVQDTSSEVRKTAHNLMPDILTKRSLIEALVIYCDTINKGKEPEIDIQFRGDFSELDKATELMLYRMVQEMVQNIIKHAHAKHAAIQLIEDNGKVMIFVEDDGVGFDIHDAEGGYGLANLRHRVLALNGEISIMSEPGRGTTIYFEFEIRNKNISQGNEI